MKYGDLTKIATVAKITTGAVKNGAESYQPGKKEAEQQRQFELKQQKRREKHRGR